MARATGPELQPFDFKLLDKRQNVMVLITPEDALALLTDHNPRNRAVKESGVARWTSEIKRGNWDPDASDIKVDVNGDLLDGQHRLMACCRADVPIGTLLRTGLRPETQHRVDVGIRRNTSDTFRLEGIQYGNNHAAAILLRRRYEEGEANGKKISSDLRQVMSPDESLDYFRSHPMHEKFALTAESMYRIGPGITRTVYFAALPMFAEADEPDATRFSEAFVGGEWGGPSAPLQALVRYMSMARAPGQKLTRNVNERHLLAIVKAWNAWRMNQSLERLRIADTDLLVPVV